jgi:FkbM family methyltransferase
MALKRIINRFRKLLKLLKRDPDRFLRSVSAVIHIGASTGQERDYYDKLGLRVLWIEPIPTVFEQLKTNISKLPRQQAIKALVTDKDNKTYKFNIASNDGESSSILELQGHKDIWPQIEFVETIELKSKTLESLLKDHNVDSSSFDVLIIDTQGSELLVLKGAVPILKHFSFIKTEVADFESYSGCCKLDDIDQFMEAHNFQQYSRHAFAHRNEGGGEKHTMT